MKVLLSQLKKYLPELNDTVRNIGDVFTLIGYMEDGRAKKVEFNGEEDYLFDLEVRQNRADNFGVMGLARELSAFYNIPLVKPSFEIHAQNENSVDFEITASNVVKRVMVTKLENLKVDESPKWLKEYLEFYGINSINNLVDISNYVMIETGHASHAFDFDKMKNKKLIWELAENKYKSFTTLAGEELELTNDAIVITDGEKVLTTSFVGGKDVAIDKSTKNILIEMAIYDGGLVRKNQRQMKALTEAGSRLEKYMDPDSIPYAFEMLISLIQEHCGGKVTSQISDKYIHKTEELKIEVDLKKAQQIAGVDISSEESKTYLTRLGFEIVEDMGNKVIVKRPIDRLDIEQEEDVFEEIIRLHGYNKIPTNELFVTVTKDVTPTHLNLIDSIKRILVENGMDEVRSWVLVDGNKNKNANWLNWESIEVTNAINNTVPFLRQTITVSLLGQLEEMNKNFIEEIEIFEEGKVFGKKEGNFEEYYSVAGLIKGKNLEYLQQILQRVLSGVGINFVGYKIAEEIPAIAHPTTCFDILVECENETIEIGKIFVTNKTLSLEATVFEINISKLDEILSGRKSNSAQEITHKIVNLDTNIVADENEFYNDLLERISKVQKNLWSWKVVDKFEQDNKTKFTVRVSYFDLTDEEAKKLHDEVFGN